MPGSSKSTRVAPADPVIEKLREIPETQLHTQIVLPLLRAMGMRHVEYLHGSFERGKDLVYLDQDAFGDDVLAVCQVKNDKFHGRASDSGNTAGVLTQLLQSKSYEVLNPSTSLKQCPQQVVLITTWSIPDRDTADGGGLLNDLKKNNIKIIGPDKFAELIRIHLRSQYDSFAAPGIPFLSQLRDAVNSHTESQILGAATARDLDSFYVDLSLQPPAGMLSELCAGRLGIRHLVNAYKQVDKSKLQAMLLSEKALPFTFGEGWIQFDKRFNDHNGTLSEPTALTLELMPGLVGAAAIPVKFGGAQILASIKKYFATRSPKRQLPHERLQALAAISTFLTDMPSAVREHVFGPTASEEAEGQIISLDVPNVEVGTLLQIGDNLCLVGEAGAGKTSLARALTRQAIRDGQKVCYFPCSRITSKDMNLKAEIIRYIGGLAPGSKRDDVQGYIDSCDVFVIDGCDEAATLRTTLWNEIDDLGKRTYRYLASCEGTLELPSASHTCFSQTGKVLLQSRSLTRYNERRVKLMNATSEFEATTTELGTAARTAFPQIIVTCRESAHIEVNADFIRLRLCPFSDSQLDEFFRAWFSENPTLAEEVLTFLSSPDNTRIRDVCRTPIVASILASLHEHGTPLPQSKTEVYERRFELLLERWQQSKRVKFDRIVPTRQKRRYLSDVALFLHSKHRRTFTLHEAGIIWNERYAASFPNANLEGLLNELYVYDNVVVRDGDGTMSLGHLSYQEFLAAWAIVLGQKGRWLATQVHDSWWREVLVFYAGLTGSAEEIFEYSMLDAGLPRDRSLIADLSHEAALTPLPIRDFVREYTEDEADWEGEELQDD